MNIDSWGGRGPSMQHLEDNDEHMYIINKVQQSQLLQKWDTKFFFKC